MMASGRRTVAYIVRSEIARKTGYVNVDFGKLLSEIKRGADVKAVKHFKMEIRIFFPRPLDALRTDVCADDFLTPFGYEARSRSPFAAYFQHYVILTDPDWYSLAVFLDLPSADEHSI